jgi:adenosine deaminase CECR1
MLTISINCFNEYTYAKARESLRLFDIKSQNKLELNEKEKIVNNYLEILKSNEFKNQGINYFYPARPLEKYYKQIINSSLYTNLKNLAKGGNLHIHEDEALDRRLFLEIIKLNEPHLFDILYICIDKLLCNEKYYFFDYFINKVPNGWTKVKYSNLTFDDILAKTTLFGILNNSTDIYPTDTSDRWKLCEDNGIFANFLSIYNHNSTRLLYLKAFLDLSLNESVQLVEFRRNSFGTMWYFDENGDKRYYSPKEEAKILSYFKQDYLESNPRLIDFNYIVFTLRRQASDEIKKSLDDFILVQKDYSSLIRGFDMVGEEDAGHTLLFHADNLINYPFISYFFHNGETNFPDDYLPAKKEDMVSSIENIYDALILKTHRIGHGLGFFKHPSLYSVLRQLGIAIEICPASNQLLGYVPDLRMHPGLNYYRSGVPIVIGGDDPATFGYNELTFDFYLIYLAWGLDLSDLKKLSLNSIQYSSLTIEDKAVAYQKWAIEWLSYINKMSSFICNENFSNDNLTVTRIFPSYGPNDVQNNVTLYGIGFEGLLCKNILCKFGDFLTKGELISYNQIKCITPIINKSNFSVIVELIANEKEFNTKVNYTFLSYNRHNNTKSCFFSRLLNFIRKFLRFI